eukprot:CAMPEP_0185587330 /NCGR_PEP_ID=MMETSP0434-20130131/48516_1 /TAXON_ID=626734 ORGANISM="Favella taraikaensis, Strain Fe Narragansett Bay" /NCGR_SAMPLE_ID=MMETSP0434 /ASSEMBLY_ACC=CAM_ASM_000379 /LENGTH=43 /DNA_ID= /DNA_START= /DNA_END= /DNA_ORIENTATION=
MPRLKDSNNALEAGSKSLGTVCVHWMPLSGLLLGVHFCLSSAE